jgi:hypothetical protein
MLFYVSNVICIKWIHLALVISCVIALEWLLGSSRLDLFVFRLNYYMVQKRHGCSHRTASSVICLVVNDRAFG